MNLAFTPSLPFRSTVPHHASSTTPVRFITQANAAKSARADTSAVKTALMASLVGVKRGILTNPDEGISAEEERVEELVESLEALNTCAIPTQSQHLDGRWRLIYTSSSITRFFGGVTGLQRLLPEGRTGEIFQVMNTEDGVMQFEEQLLFELPIVGVIKWNVLIEGVLRASSPTRQVWEAETVKLAFFKWFADGWKTVRAFQISDITYLDDGVRITRGQTDSINIFERDISVQ